MASKSNAGQTFYQGFIARGFSPVQAAVLAGNAQQESGFNPAAWNAASQAGGSFQWRLDRLTGLQNYAEATGRPADDPNVQMDFVVHEMLGPEAKNAAAFLNATDVPSANAAIKKYIRYGDNEAGNRLQNSLAFANQKPQTPAVAAATDVAQAQPVTKPGFVNPAFPDAMAAPQTPQVAPAAVAPAQIAQPAPAQAAGPSDDDLLSAWAPKPTDAPATVGDAATALAATGKVDRPAAATDPNSDDALLAQFATAPSQTGAADVNNPMAVRKPNAPGTPANYTPSAVPWMDPVNAFASSAVTALPIIGHPLMQMADAGDAAINNLMGFPTQTGDDRAAANAGDQAKFPLASGAGAVAGTVAPLALMGSTALGGKLLGTSGNLLTRTVAGGLSSGAIGGTDALVRGESPIDAGKTALIDAGLGGAMAPLGSAIAGGGKNMLVRAGTGAAGGAAVGGVGTLAAGGSLDQAEHNALVGAGVGAGAGIAGSLANKVLAGSTSPEVAQLAQAARDKYGIPVGPGQISTNPLIKRTDSLVNKIPFSGGTASNAEQSAAFSGAIAKEMGSPGATSLSPAVMGPAKTRISGVFQQVAKKTAAIPADTQFDNDVLGAMTAAQNSMTPQQFAPLNNQFNDIMSTFKNGNNAISGDTYLKMTERGSPLDAAMSSSDPAIAGTARQLKDALDGAMQRAATPEDAKALQTARYQWKVMRTVEDMAEKAPVGTVSPALLMGAVRKNFPNMAYDGGGNMGELARIGQQFLKEPGTSGTAENLKLYGGIAGLGDLALNPQHIPAAAAIGAGVVGAGRVAGTVLRSKALANTLINAGTGNSQNVATPTVNMLMRMAPTAIQAPMNQDNMLLGPGPGGNQLVPRLTVNGATILPPGSLDPGRPF